MRNADSLQNIMVTPIFTLVGVVIGGTLTFFKDLWIERRRQKIERQYISILIIYTLEDFIQNCIDVVRDDGLCNGQPNEDGCIEPQVPLPILSFTQIDASWKSLPTQIMHEILVLPISVNKANRYIEFVAQTESSPPGYEEIFMARRIKYSDLGLLAMKITADLRKIIGIKGGTDDERWSRKEIFANAKISYEKAMRKLNMLE